MIKTTPTFDTFQETYAKPIEAHLLASLPNRPEDKSDRLYDAMKYSLLAGGKRIRPLIVLASHSLFSDNPKSIFTVATAIEMIHTYSLIHDDLPAMDDDDTRRGKPTCHKQFDDATAILAGDTLNTLAFELLATNLPKTFSDDRVLMAITNLSQACGLRGLAGGQTLDLQHEHAPESMPNSEETLTRIHDLKTGALFESCLTIPALLSGANDTELGALRTYGKYLGRLFQITDDILDVTQDKETLGKSPNKDSEQNKLTYISLFGLEGAQKKATLTADLAESALHPLNYDLSLLKELIQKIRFRIY